MESLKHWNWNKNNTLRVYRGADYADFYGFTVKDGMAYGVIDGKIVVVDIGAALYFENQGFFFYILTKDGWERKYWHENDCRLENTVVRFRGKEYPLLPFCCIATDDDMYTDVESVYKWGENDGFTFEEVDLIRAVYDLMSLHEWYDLEEEEEEAEEDY